MDNSIEEIKIFLNMAIGFCPPLAPFGVRSQNETINPARHITDLGLDCLQIPLLLYAKNGLHINPLKIHGDQLYMTVFLVPFKM